MFTWGSAEAGIGGVVLLVIVSLVCWVKVLKRMFREGTALGIAGVLVGLVAFVYGWAKVKTFDILSTMVVWTVCAVLAVASLLSIMLPPIMAATGRAQMTRMMMNGRAIHGAVFAAGVEREPLGFPPPWPTTTGEHPARSSSHGISRCRSTAGSSRCDSSTNRRSGRKVRSSSTGEAIGSV